MRMIYDMMYHATPLLNRFPLVSVPSQANWTTIEGGTHASPAVSQLSLSGVPLTISVIGYVESVSFVDEDEHPLPVALLYLSFLTLDDIRAARVLLRSLSHPRYIPSEYFTYIIS